MYPHEYALIGIPADLILLVMTVIAVALFARAMYLRVLRPILQGRKEHRFDRLAERIGIFLLYVIAQRKVFDKPLPGVMHAFIFWGFIIWQPFTLNFVLEGLSQRYTLASLFGGAWLAWVLLVEVFTVLILLGILLNLYRRLVVRPPFVEPSVDAMVIMALIAGLMITHLLSKGLSFNLVQDETATWYPVSLAVAQLLAGLDPSEATATVWHNIFWWGHVTILLSFLVYIPYSKHLHLVAAPFNIFFRSLEPRGTLSPIPDIETTETFGAGKLSDLSWKQLLDLDTCTECGRCTENCPAYLSGKPLSPRDLILDLKFFSHELQPDHQTTILAGRLDPPVVGPEAMVGGVVADETLWSCVTCGACMANCPVFIEHVPTIVDMRRYLVMTEGRIPEATQNTLRTLERQGHPWRGTQYIRGDWTEGMEVPQFTSGEEVEYLYWVGCTGALDDRSRSITAATIKVLQAASVSFGVLGAEETCTGDPARRLGNEYLFQMMAQQTIEILNSRKAKKIVTHCPHCFNTIKNEYPQLGGNYEVIHHTQLMVDLMKQGKLKMTKPVAEGETITYHDSCYLGRHNGEFQAPRKIAHALPGAKVVEMARNREQSFCCGAGGGNAWMEMKKGTNINRMRTEQAQEVGASIIAVACPFCVVMFEDGIRQVDAVETMKTKDLVELVAEALG